MLENGTSDDLNLGRPAVPRASPDSILLWAELSELRDGMKSFRRQMEKMVEHVDELETTLFAPNQGGDQTVGAKSNSPGREERLLAMREAGFRIKTRLWELIDEYDEYIRHCTTLMDGMNLATQIVSRLDRSRCSIIHRHRTANSGQEWNRIGRHDALLNQAISRSNLEVAYLVRKDGNLMKSIAVLTMVFLPGYICCGIVNPLLTSATTLGDSTYRYLAYRRYSLRGYLTGARMEEERFRYRPTCGFTYSRPDC